MDVIPYKFTGGRHLEHTLEAYGRKKPSKIQKGTQITKYFNGGTDFTFAFLMYN